MILLESGNRIIQEALEKRIKGDTREACDITLADFDGVQFHVVSTAEDKDRVTISLQFKHFEQLKKSGAEDVINNKYKSYVVADEPGYHLTLAIDLKNLPADKDGLLNDLVNLKRNIMGGPLARILDKVATGKSSATDELVELHYRPDESVYIQPGKDQVTLVFCIRFKDPDDIIIAKVFLQEFAEARRQVQNAPSVQYLKDPPGELKNVSNVPVGDDIGYVTFVLFKRQCEASQHVNTITNILTFRDYLHYHIKCSKAYMHSRMRARVDALLKVLNRAKQDTESKAKRTMDGRVFVRK